MKQLLVFWGCVGVISCLGTTGIRIHKFYEERKQDKKFGFEIQFPDKSEEVMTVYRSHPRGYSVGSEGGYGSGWHGFYEKNDSFVYIQILDSEVFVLRKNPYARFIINVNYAGKVSSVILAKTDFPTAYRFTMVENTDK